MELKVVLKDQAPHALPHGAFFRIDLKDRHALRQGNIALIHSAPTGDAAILFPACPGIGERKRRRPSDGYARP
jgi:hypothetical protein